MPARAAPSTAQTGARHPWYRSPLDRASLRALCEKDDLRGAACILLHMGLLFATGSAVRHCVGAGELLLCLPMLLAHGFIYSFLGWAGAGHELSHSTVFRTPRLNRIFLQLFSLLSWNNYIYFQKSHAIHHARTLVPNVDLEVVLPQRIDWLNYGLALFLDVQGLYRALRITLCNSLGRIPGEQGKRLFPAHAAADRQALFRWARIVFACHVSLATLFVLSAEYVLLLLVTFAPFICTCANRLLAQAQHFGMRSGVTDFRQNARTIVLGAPLRFLYWSMNYHIEHHMYPGVPFFRLPQLHDKIRHDLPPPTAGLLGAALTLIALNHSQGIRHEGA